MGLLGKLFGNGGPSIETLRKAVAQKRFAQARLDAEQLAGQSLNEADAAEVERLRVVAGDGLAQLNLNEALGMQHCGNLEQAQEHLQLALEQVCSAGLREEIEQVLQVEPEIVEVMPLDSERSGSCISCSPQATALPDAENILSDDAESQLELILTSYPSGLAERYQAKGEVFRDAFLLSHAGRDDQALPVWRQVDPAEQDDLYWFELGSLFARTEQLEDARTALERALKQNPELMLAIEALVPVLVATGDISLAVGRLQEFLGSGVGPMFCHAQLASLYVRQGEFGVAEEQARLSLLAGNDDPGFLMLAASILETNGKIEEAEELLMKLPGTGCGGGISLPLAEFWLRHKRDLGKSLDVFNAACREDPENPRWQLRVAQTYLARNWHKDGVKLLRKVVNDPRLETGLAEEAERLLAEIQG